MKKKVICMLPLLPLFMNGHIRHVIIIIILSLQLTAHRLVDNRIMRLIISRLKSRVSTINPGTKACVKVRQVSDEKSARVSRVRPQVLRHVVGRA